MTNIISHIRGYSNAGDRKRAIAQLRKRGFNYFVCFREKTSDHALQFSVCEWVTKERGVNGVYIDW